MAKFNYIFILIFGFLLLPGTAFASKQAFTFEHVVEQAKNAARKPFKEVSDKKIPDFLKQIGYDEWRDIRFKDDQALWAETRAFKVKFFHLGFIYQKPVIIHIVGPLGTYESRFSPEFFDYGKTKLKDRVPLDLDFAGFRIHYPLNSRNIFDELVVFLGASYFRALGKNQGYGMSVRGLAIDTAVQSGEEFPFFKEFWIVQPKSRSKEITIYALLDSPRITGAYQYIIRPGEETVMDVTSVLFTRKRIQKLGIAPLTSMFFYGENTGSRADDFRPEVHDSDGVLIATKQDEWIWHPLKNPQELAINSFDVGTPQGFGLMQRDTNFDHYQDLESRFDARPSVWVTPQGDWGKGHVEAVQIPSPNEYNDNMNAFWVPEKPVEAGQTLKFAYTLSWCNANVKLPPTGYVTDTRAVRHGNKEGARFLIDFQGKRLNAIKKIPAASIHVTKGYKITDWQVIKNTAKGGWRLVFQIQMDKEGPFRDLLPNKIPAADLRAFLTDGSHALTETWTYTYSLGD
jgi:periplasmic glucans biosynthesis protein